MMAAITKMMRDSFMHSLYTERMTMWESGRESALLDEIIAGRKTVEGRLNRSKFAQYKVGDTIKLRRDVRQPDGTLRDECGQGV